MARVTARGIVAAAALAAAMSGTLNAAGAAASVELVRVHAPGRAGVAQLERLGLDVGEDARSGSVSVLLRGLPELRLLRATGFPFRVLVHDLAAADRAAMRADAAAAQAEGPSALPSGRRTYRVYGDYIAELRALARDHPAIARGLTLSHRTVQGRPIEGVELAAGVARRDDGRPSFLLVALHHAREWPAAESAIEFARMLAEGYGRDRRMTRLLQRVRVVVVPVLNADGFIESREAPASELTALEIPLAVAPPGGVLAYRRKNCAGALPAGAPCLLEHGVDLNRNYAAGWGGQGASTLLTDQTFRGPGPFSEPEAAAVRDLVLGRNFTALLTIHNVAALVLRPPSVRGAAEPDEARLKQLGDAMGDATGYTSELGYELYDSSGVTEDWAYAAAGIFGYTIELGPPDGGFHGPYQQNVIDQWTGTGSHAGRGVREAYLLAAEEAAATRDHAILRGTAPAGRVLRLTKTFATSTASQVCELECLIVRPAFTVPERIDLTTVVPRTSRFTWHLNPSTRPAQKAAGQAESYTLTCETAAGRILETRSVTVDRGKALRVRLECR
jgi:hypothetical protein